MLAPPTFRFGSFTLPKAFVLGCQSLTLTGALGYREPNKK
jgi:hypothetical protein